MIKYNSTLEYHELVLKESGKWDMITNELSDCGKCEFCGHSSKSGYWIINKTDNRKLLVGTDCVFVLCGLNKAQQRAIKYKEALHRNNKKYAVVVAYLRNNHNIKFPMPYNYNFNNADEIATAIIYKVTQTTGINPFWIEQYKKVTGKDLKELLK